MGLLNKASSIIEKESGKKEKGGLLEKAARYSESKEKAGLLKKAEEYQEPEESEPEEEEGGGLLEKASGYAEEEGEGLLQKARGLAREGKEGLLEKVHVVPEERAGLLERAQEILSEKKGLLERAILISEEEEVSLPEEERPLPKEELKEVEELAEEKEEVVKSHQELLEQYLKEKDPFSILLLFDGIIREEGYSNLFKKILETACNICSGESGVLFALYGDRYRVEDIFFKEKQKKGINRLNFKERSKLVQLIKRKGNEPVRSSAAKKESLGKEIASFKPLEPWMIVPLIVGATLSGFMVIGSQPKRARIEKEDLLLFAHLAASYVSIHSIEKDIQVKEEQLIREKEDTEALLNLYNYSEVSAGNLKEMLERVSLLFNIERAVITTGWNEKGALTVKAGIGIPQNELHMYRATKSDREIKSIIKNGEPDVPKDLDERIADFLKDYSIEIKSYIVVPVIFNDETLAVLNIFNMKGVGKKISKRQKITLKHIARCLTPHLLYSNLIDIDPFVVLESHIEREVKKAKQYSYPLHIVTCILKDSEEALKKEEFDSYRVLLDKLYRNMQEVVSEDGFVKMVSWKKIVLLLRNMQKGKVDAILNSIKNRFSGILKKEKKELTLSFKKTAYPKETGSLSDILNTIY